MLGAYERWTQGRQIISPGTNAGATKLPFQGWKHFKEAFAPELVARAVDEAAGTIKTCIDPFGGSGTTALTCQFLGVRPVTVEVNPYLADLIESKLSIYDVSALNRDFCSIIREVQNIETSCDLGWLPKTFVYPGVNNRWIYPLDVAQRIGAYRCIIEKISLIKHRRFFLALLGGFLIDVSNVFVSGKGRRYRKNWQSRFLSAQLVDDFFFDRVTLALGEISKYSDRPEKGFKLIRGDCRKAIAKAPESDLAIFSPPYPNSFDYTDVYNVELWMLGYLRTACNNKKLRESTLTSHVQVLRKYSTKPEGSTTLDQISEKLHLISKQLWSPWIPSMIDGYFFDMLSVLEALSKRLKSKGEIWAVVGDSLYSDTHIPVAKILEELAPSVGLNVIKTEAFRSMRSSAQQGWRAELSESLVVFRKKY